MKIVKKKEFNICYVIRAASIATNMYSYSYDSVGNSLHSACNAATNLYTANALNQYTAILRDSAPPCEPTYDADGNLTAWNGTALEWDPDNRLYYGGGGTSDFGFFRDWSGRAFSETENAYYTDRVFDGWNPVYERLVDGWTETPVSDTVYVWGTDLSGTMRGVGGVGGLLAVKRNGVWYAPLYDANGNITAYVSENGDTVATYEYDAFGATISQSGMMADSFRHRFSTKPWIAAFGVYDFGERLYSPELRRWLSRDPIGESDSANLYLYCHNSALQKFDFIGLKANWHHLLPRQFETKFAAVGLDINSAEYGIILEELEHIGQGGVHPYWNRDWASFFANNPNATKTQILSHLDKMKNLPQYKLIFEKGVKARLGYIAWRKAADQARKSATKAASKSLARRGVAQGAKKVVKHVPIVGLVFVYTDIRDKGFVKGTCNSLLDACPFIGWGKLGIECIWGDWFPDNEDHRNE